MDDLSPRAKARLEQYRRASATTAPSRARMWARLQAELPPAAPARSHRTRWIVSATALAAAALLIAWSLRSTTVSPGEEETHQSAPYRAPTPGPRVAQDPNPVPDPEDVPEPVPVPDNAPVPVPDNVLVPVPDNAPVPAKVPAPVPDNAPVPDPPEPTDAPSDPLARETLLLRQAKSALERDAPDRALELLAEHERRFPRGQLREDRSALRIETLCSSGKLVQGRGELELFARRHPASHHLVRLRTRCASKTP